MRISSILTFSLVLLLAAASLHAQDMSADDIQGITTGTEMVGRGHLQLESSISLERDGLERNITWGNVLLRFGMTDWLEATLEGNLLQKDAYTTVDKWRGFMGLGPVVVGAKARLYRGGDWAPAVGLCTDIAIPLDRGPLWEGNDKMSLHLLVDKYFTSQLYMLVTMGFLKEEWHGNGTFHAATYLEYAFNAGPTIFVESDNFFKGGEPPKFILETGVTIPIGKRIEIDIFADVNFGQLSSYYAYGIGFNWLIL